MVVSQSNSNQLIDGFINRQVVQRGLDERTAKAYRLDLEHLHEWLSSDSSAERDKWEGKMEAYLEYLSLEKKRQPSTLYRKQKVFNYYLAYLSAQGIIEKATPLKSMCIKKDSQKNALLTKKEIDAFFQAIIREYGELDSDFRKRVCMRDQVMMGLLFYHGIEVSELLRMQVKDYNRKTAILTIKKKNGKEYSVHLFSKTLQEQMVMWLDNHEYFEWGAGYDEWMFLSKLGKPLSMKMVTNIFDKYRKLAGIEKEVTPKDLKSSMKRYAEELMMEWCG